jgi:hypothetical protein
VIKSCSRRMKSFGNGKKFNSLVGGGNLHHSRITVEIEHKLHSLSLRSVKRQQFAFELFRFQNAHSPFRPRINLRLLRGRSWVNCRLFECQVPSLCHESQWNFRAVAANVIKASFVCRTNKPLLIMQLPKANEIHLFYGFPFTSTMNN